MSNIFIPAGIRDKAMRDTLISIVREMNKFGEGSNIKLYDQDPGVSTAGTAGDIIYSESSNSIWVFSNDGNWVLTAGISDSQASQGYTGTKKFTGTLYYQSVQTSNPGAPTAATWSIPNNDFLSITPSGVWSHTQPAVTITNTLAKEWHTNYTVTLDTSVDPITSTVTFTYPSGAIQVTDDIESDNYSPGSTGWSIRRDDGYAEFGAAAIRGQLTSNQIAANAITADKINVNSLDAISANLGTITVDTANIANLAVQNAKIANNAVFTANILDNAVTQSSNVNFSTQSGAGPYTFSTSIYMPFAGDIIALGTVIMLGTFPSSASVSMYLSISGTIMQSVRGSGDVMAASNSFSGSKFVSAGVHTITLNVYSITGVGSPSANASLTLLRRFK